MSGLTVLEVRNAKPGRYADGNGLYLLVRKSGSRSWVFRWTINGKRKDIGLGSVATVPLAKARAKAFEARMRAEAGEEVSPTRVADTVQSSVPTFGDAARACHRTLKAGWANRRHTDSWLRSLELYMFPRFGETPVDQITSVMVRDALAPIWLRIPETARRALQRTRTVLDYAHIEGWCPHEASLRSVTRGLPRQPPDEGHFEAMPYPDVPAFFSLIAAQPVSVGRDALMFTILNGVRSGETRYTIWEELDLDGGIWTIPANRMKMRQTHVVPLSAVAIAILKRLWRFRTSDEGYVFSIDGRRPISDMTMTQVLRHNGHPKFTVHGFRSSFTDWAAETTETPKEVVDKALAHKLLDRVEAAYRRTDFFERRRTLMNAWMEFVTKGSVFGSQAPVRQLQSCRWLVVGDVETGVSHPGFDR